MWQEKREKGGKKKEALYGMFWSVEEVVWEKRGKKEKKKKKVRVRVWRRKKEGKKEGNTDEKKKKRN